MSRLTIKKGAMTRTVEFEGTPMLSDVLSAEGLYVLQPCGGRGVCGKCAAEMSGAIETERSLICRARLLGDACVTLPEDKDAVIETESSAEIRAAHPMPGAFGAAVDIGTTTLAVKCFDLKTGRLLREGAMLNPQGAVAADVIGRISASMAGQRDALQKSVTDAIGDLVGEEKDSLVITGNTTMLYLLTGRAPDALSRAPFIADCLFGHTEKILGADAYLPPCTNAFVGADITCAALASGMCDRDEVSLLIDIGTNGEIALWKDGRLFVTSTAAGPAFEGAGISCGCGSVTGAIDRVERDLSCHTIGDAKAVGVCGSGLIDAIAAYLETGDIDETGAIEEDELPLRDGIALTGRDVRAVQLAKAAIAAGTRTVLQLTNTPVEQVRTLYIAGGFGSHLRVESAVRIGLIPCELGGRVKVIGNAALAGAAMLLLDREEIGRAKTIARNADHVNLGGNSVFNNFYMDEMGFPEE